MRVQYRLPGLRPGIEHDPVAGVGHPGGHSHLPGLRGDLVQQPAAGRGERRQVSMVFFRDYQYVHRSLGIYVTKRDRARAL
jgi:hypothetical protein